jgi:pimeloyl-ACP methyl ester carboxylesterase
MTDRPSHPTFHLDRALPILLLGLLLAGSTEARPAPADQKSLTQRRALAESGSFLEAVPPADKASSAQLATAFDVPVSLLTSSSISGAANANGVFSNLGVITPTSGTSFALLSTGIVGTTPEPGTDLSPGGTEGDRITLTLQITAPQGRSQLSFDFNFLSAEYPDFIGSQFNDSFFVTVSDNLGTRTIAEASVNSSFFFPASASRAGGSGFDIFTPDPDGVDQSFGTGLPDAGLTDYQSATAEIDSNGSITLVFTIEDRGDGILDSAVILDNFNLAAFDVVDLNDPRFLVGGQVMTDPDVLREGGEPRRGVAADGVSRLLLRSSVGGPGSMRYCLAGGSTAPQDGGVDSPGGDDRRQCVTVPAASTAGGRKAFAIYRAPEDFNRGGDEALDRREVRIEAEFTPAGGGAAIVTEAVLQIVRPPLILVHGLWSGPSTWMFPLATDSRFLVRKVNYDSSSGAAFRANRNVVFDEIRAALVQSRLRGYATTQVDVAGHSMGGLLTRIWVDDPSYRRNDNYFEGDVNKLLTLDTPHTGSPLANISVGLREAFLVGDLFASTMCYFDRAVDTDCARCQAPGATSCAVDDLSKESAAINSIGRAEVPGHALVGKGGSDLIGDIGSAGSNLSGWLGSFFSILSFYGDLSQIFPGLQHDLIVGRPSQEGGMPASARTVFGNGDGVHFRIPLLAAGNTASTAYSNRLAQLLNTDVSSPEFAEFPAPATLPSAIADPELLQFHPRTARAIEEGTLNLTLVGGGTDVASGQTVRLRAVPDPGKTVERVLFVGQETAGIDQDPPFEMDLTIPDEAIGALSVSAVGSNSSGDYFTANTIALQVEPTASLESIEILPSEGILFGPGASEQLLVIGDYADGVQRDITPSTTYQSADPDIATVSSSGVVTAVAPGLTTIVATNGGVQDSITTTVLDESGGSSGACTPSSDRLCLNGNRFRVEVSWRDFQGNTGEAQAVPFGSDDSGLLWFFDSDNWEMLVKVLDGCGFNDHYWVFAAATTNVEYRLTVTDEQTGESTSYFNPLGQSSSAITDIEALAVCDSGSTSAASLPVDSGPRVSGIEASTSPTPKVPSARGTAKGDCAPSSSNLCLSGDRFQVEVGWRDFQGNTGQAQVVPFGSDDSGLLWFFAPDNWEMLIKVLDGCDFNDRFWVFAAATTNVEYTVTVTDTETGADRTYTNPLGVSSPALTDTDAFATCP